MLSKSPGSLIKAGEPVSLNNISTSNLKPDLTFLLDLNLESSKKRTFSRNNDGQIDKFEKKDSIYHKKVKDGFLEILKNNNDRIIKIDASKDIYEISELFISKKATELYFYVAFTTFFVISLYYKNLRKFLWIETILIIFLGFFFARASLLLSFSVYFVFWHSIPSILDQLNFLYQKDNARKMKYFLSSLPYWIMSILGLFGFYFYFHTKDIAFVVFLIGFKSEQTLRLKFNFTLFSYRWAVVFYKIFEPVVVPVMQGYVSKY